MGARQSDRVLRPGLDLQLAGSGQLYHVMMETGNFIYATACRLLGACTHATSHYQLLATVSSIQSWLAHYDRYILVFHRVCGCYSLHAANVVYALKTMLTFAAHVRLGYCCTSLLAYYHLC